MSAPDPSKDGTFEDLDDLREDGRRRFVKRLSKEELEEIIVAAWRERDEARARVEVQATEINKQADVPAPEPVEQTVAHAKTVVETIHTVSTEKAGVPKNQKEKHTAIESVSAAPLQKHTGTDAMEKRIVSHLKSSETRSTAPITTLVEKQREVPEPKREEEDETGHFAVYNDEHDAEPFARCDDAAGTEDIAIHKTQDERFDKLLIVFSLPGTNGGDYQGIERLPVQVRTELQKRFNEFHNAKKYKREALSTLLRGPQRYIVRPHCVTDQVLRELALKHKGKAIPSQKFFLGGELGHSADDKCIKLTIPCTHIVKYEGAYALCFVPLPRKQRGDIPWTDLRFWVQDWPSGVTTIVPGT